MEGQIWFLTRSMQPTPFQAYKLRVTHLFQLKQHSILVSVGQDEQGINPLVKVWNLDKRDSGNPLCTRIFPAIPGNKPTEVSCLSVHENLNFMAIGFTDGSVVLTKGDITRDRHSKTLTLHDLKIWFLTRSMQPTPFQAYKLRVTHLFQLKQHSILVSVGQDEQGINPLVKVWNLDKRDSGNPLCTRIFPAIPGNKPTEVSCLSVHENLNFMAIGFTDGSVVLTKGDITRDRHSKTLTLHEGTSPITGLAFRQSGKITNLFIATLEKVLCYTLSLKEYPRVELDTHGCALRCTALTDPSQDSQFIVAGDECVYLYQPDERGPCFGFEGQKLLVHWYRGYLLLLTRDCKTPNKEASPSEKQLLTVYDLDNKFIAYSAAFDDVIDVLAEWGSLYILTRDRRLCMLFKKNLFVMAINLAKNQHLDSDGLSEIFRQYGDHLYVKGDHDGAIQQYIRSEFGSREASPSEKQLLTVYDLDNKFIAYSAAFDDVIDVLAEWGSLYILTRDRRLCMLFKKNLFVMAINLAKNQHLDSDGLSEIFRQYGDHLYVKGDHDGAIQQYIRTIGKLEPSYVIRKFLDAQRIHNLTAYLQALHRQSLANAQLSEFGSREASPSEKQLLTVYDLDNKFIAYSAAFDDVIDVLAEWGSLYILTRDRRLCVLQEKDTQTKLETSESEVHFDVEIAIKVLRQAGYYSHAVFLAEKHTHHEWYLKIQLEDLKNYQEALRYIGRLPFEQAESNMKRYGKTLMHHVPEETTRLLKGLCTDYRPSRETPADRESLGHTLGNKANSEEFIAIFVNNPRELRAFLEHMMEVEAQSPQGVYDTLLELRLQDWAHEQDTQEKNSLQEAVLSLLKSENYSTVFDKALVLCQMHNFKEGANSEEFIAIFVNNPRELRAFLEHMMEVEAQSPQGVYDTLLELRLQDWAHEQDTQEKNSLQEAVLSLLKSENYSTVFDKALVLCQMHNFKEGVLYLYEQGQLYQQIMHYHMQNEEYGKVVEACQRYGEKEACLWEQALGYFARKEEDCKEYITAVLQHIDRTNLMPPLLGERDSFYRETGLPLHSSTLAHNSTATLSVIKDYLINKLQQESEQISEDERKIREYRVETTQLRQEIKELRSRRRVKAQHSDSREKNSLQEAVLSLLKSENYSTVFDKALVLCQMHNFKEGVLYLYEQGQLYQQIMHYHMQNEEYGKVVEACQRYGEKEACLWEQALGYFARKEEDCKEYITAVLQHIDRTNLMPPLLGERDSFYRETGLPLHSSTLAHNSTATLSVIKDYLINKLQQESEQISEDERKIREYRVETTQLRQEIEELRSSAKIFQKTKCSMCNSPLELPSVHFLCSHSFHQHCFESYAESEAECPTCAPDNRKLKCSNDGFSVVADYFGRGVFNKLTLITDPPGGKAGAASLDSDLQRDLLIHTKRTV
ncbi:UNVERIFIED_CONTAM: hypothetical protein FKN15_059462 [Acipenser sinensis]